MSLPRDPQAIADQLLKFCESSFVTTKSLETLPKDIKLSRKEFLYFLRQMRLRVRNVSNNMPSEEILDYCINENNKEIPVPTAMDIGVVVMSGLANHHEATSFCFYYALEEEVEQNIETIIVKSNERWRYSLILIGRPLGTTLDDINTWGQDVIVCDPKAHQYYGAHELLGRLKKKKIDAPIFSLRQFHYGAFTESDGDKYDSTSETVKNIIKRLMDDACYRTFLKDKKFLSVLDYLKNLYKKSHPEKLAVINDVIDSMKKLTQNKSSQVLGHTVIFTTTPGLLVKQALHEVTKKVVDKEWSANKDKDKAWLVCNTNDEVTEVIALLDEAGINAGIVPNTRTIVVSPLPIIMPAKITFKPGNTQETTHHSSTPRT